jgi:hypothetical protein
MSSEALRQAGPATYKYPWRIIIVRWLLLAIEAGIAIFYVMKIRLELAILYIVYGVVCLFLLLPLIRCVRCRYYGKRCNFGWGVWVSRVFPRDEVNPQAAFYGYTILFWPLRIIPIVVALRLYLMYLIGIFIGMEQRFTLDTHGFFLIYLATIFIHRRFYRFSACTRCHEKSYCPVYNSQAILSHGGGADTRPRPTVLP